MFPQELSGVHVYVLWLVAGRKDTKNNKKMNFPSSQCFFPVFLPTKTSSCKSKGSPLKTNHTIQRNVFTVHLDYYLKTQLITANSIFPSITWEHVHFLSRISINLWRESKTLAAATKLLLLCDSNGFSQKSFLTLCFEWFKQDKTNWDFFF